MSTTFVFSTTDVATNTSNPKVVFHVAATNRDIVIARFRVDFTGSAAAFADGVSWKKVNAAGTAGSTQTYALHTADENSTETADFTLTAGPASSTQWSTPPTFVSATTGGGDWTDFITSVPSNSGNVIDFNGHNFPHGGILIKKGTTKALVLPTTSGGSVAARVWCMIRQ